MSVRSARLNWGRIPARPRARRLDDAGALLEHRAAALRGKLASLDADLTNAPAELRRVDKLGDEYLRAMTAAELSWIEGVIGDLQNGSLTWSYQEAAEADLRSGPAAVPE